MKDQVISIRVTRDQKNRLKAAQRRFREKSLSSYILSRALYMSDPDNEELYRFLEGY